MPHAGEFVLSAMRTGIEFSLIAQKVDDTAVAGKSIENIAKADNKYSDTVYDYFADGVEFGTAHELLLAGALHREICVLQMLPDEKLDRVFEWYTGEMTTLINAIYNEEALSDGNENLLPANHRFVLYINRAETARERGDTRVQLINLRKALGMEATFSRTVERLLEKAQQDIKSTEANRSEFDMLAQQLLLKVTQMVKAGQKDEAKPIVDKLAAMMPDNFEVRRLQKELLNM